MGCCGRNEEVLEAIEVVKEGREKWEKKWDLKTCSVLLEGAG